MALSPVFPGLSMSLFFWLVVVRREKLFGLNIGKVGARAWRRVSNSCWARKCRRLGLDKEPGMGRDETGRAGSRRRQI